MAGAGGLGLSPAAYRFFREQGLPAPRTGFAQVVVNGSVRGLYTLVETPDRAFAERWFASTVHLYESEAEGDRKRADLADGRLADFEAVAGSEVDYADLQALVDAAGHTALGGFMQALEPHLCWEQVVRAWAAEAVVDTPDGYTGRGRHYLLHLDGAGAASLLPWCLDEAFGGKYRNAHEEDGARSVLFERCLAEPGCALGYWQALADTVTAMRAFDVEALLRQQGPVLDPFVDSSLPRGRADARSAAMDGKRKDLGVMLARRLDELEATAGCRVDPADDLDRDGVPCASDCNPLDAAVGAGTSEVCGDGADDDCSGQPDDGPACSACREARVGPHRYLFCHGPLSWSQARASCQAQGSDLAIPNTVAELRLLAGGALNGPRWLGLSDRAEEGVFQGVDATPVTFPEYPTPWWREGSRDGVADSDCVAASFDAGQHAAWCERPLPYVCEDPCAPGLDEDGDGHPQCGDDCNDGAADIHPDAHDGCDGPDADCDGVNPSCDDGGGD